VSDHTVEDASIERNGPNRRLLLYPRRSTATAIPMPPPMQSAATP
jgi:hypothetical protein